MREAEEVEKEEARMRKAGELENGERKEER